MLSLISLEEKPAHPNVAAQKNLPESRLFSTSVKVVALGLSGIPVQLYPWKCRGLTARVSRLTLFVKKNSSVYAETHLKNHGQRTIKEHARGSHQK